MWLHSYNKNVSVVHDYIVKFKRETAPYTHTERYVPDLFRAYRSFVAVLGSFSTTRFLQYNTSRQTINISISLNHDLAFRQTIKPKSKS